jgi:hypothetical protein
MRCIFDELGMTVKLEMNVIICYKRMDDDIKVDKDRNECRYATMISLSSHFSLLLT